MKIAIANQKGGAGKTMLCILWANYLSLKKKEEVLVLDMDFQSSIFDKWITDWQDYEAEVREKVYLELKNIPQLAGKVPEIDKADLTNQGLKEMIVTLAPEYREAENYIPLLEEGALEETRPYEVLKYDMADYDSLKPLLIDYNDSYIIMDLPGRLDDDDLITVYQDVDLILVPTAYDQVTNQSTLTFAGVVKHLNPAAKLVFIPNRVKHSVKYLLKKQIHEVLGGFGYVANDIKDLIIFQRINTYSIGNDVYESIFDTFEDIYDRFMKKSV